MSKPAFTASVSRRLRALCKKIASTAVALSRDRTVANPFLSHFGCSGIKCVIRILVSAKFI